MAIKKEFTVKATVRTDKDGKKKIVDIHFPYDTIRSLIDLEFMKGGKR